MWNEYRPDLRLSPYIRNYWIAEGYWTDKETIRLLPDGNVEIIINITKSNPMKPFVPYLMGALTTYLDFTVCGVVKILGIVFRLGATGAFIHEPIHLFTGYQTDILSVDSIFDSRFYDEIHSKTTTQDLLQYVNTYLIKQLDKLQEKDKLILAAVNEIYNAKGNLSIQQLSAHVCLCKRQVERRFKFALGLSPKTFSRIVRFNYTLNQLKENAHENILSTAVECGYYDHAHLTKEFNDLSGNTPSHFL